MSVTQNKPKAFVHNVEVMSETQIIVHVTLYFDDNYMMGYHPMYNANEYSSDQALQAQVVNDIKARWDRVNNLKFLAKQYNNIPIDW